MKIIVVGETGIPICPITIQVTRSIMRGESFLPKPGKIKVTIGKPIYLTGKDWNEVLRFHSLVRSEIAKNCGEPVIDIIVAGPVR
jgi:fatty-acyl-CoA synthase